MSVHLPVLTQSEKRTFSQCPKKHEFAYVQGYRPLDVPEPLHKGRLIDRALKAWHGAESGQKLDQAIEALRGLTVDDYELAYVGAMLRGYDARWCNEEIEIIEVGKKFEVPLVNPETGAASRTYRMAGEIDALAKLFGEYYIYEEKSTSEDVGPGSTYWKRLVIDPQVSTYIAACKALGYDVHGCLYDVLYKPGLRPLRATPVESRKYTKNGALYANQRDTDETPAEYHDRLIAAISEQPDRYYQRGTVVRTEAEEKDAAWDMWTTARMIADAIKTGRHPRNPDACIRFGRECEYFGVCTNTESLEDTTRFYQVTDVHPELSPTKAA